MAKQDNTLILIIGAAVVAGIYFMAKQPAAPVSPVIPPNPAFSNPNDVSYIENTNVSDIMSSLSNKGAAVVSPPLQLAPPDSETLSSLNLDLVNPNPSSNEMPIASEENQEDV